MDNLLRERCATALKALMKEPAAVDFFNDPVDPIALGIPEYFDVITKPMDLGTIKSKLTRKKEYTSKDDLNADVKLVWANCKKFNPKGEPMGLYEYANAMDARWKALLKEHVTD
eukprot:CAMPEP_0182877074 /NCGR_PEP_ID=MMETSP0034_2-20130328/14534_1 /TAXON_ID=156128 /ORGANISM="Nephroselmis pyriformis, Strain CCMP717" /LENGTH=113 /DNA_ID=CAMNT_0025009895 /DNA_START=75 /DNA_END=413 /DNA_ORIENTATION=-